MRGRFKQRAVLGLGTLLLAFLGTRAAGAAPWAEEGDAQLRSDVEVLAAWGYVDNVTTQWPLPWGGLIARLQQPMDLGMAPYYVRETAQRVQAEGLDAIRTDGMNYSLSVDYTNLPDVVRGFDALGREDAQGQLSAEWMGESTAIRLNIGAQSTNRRDHQIYMLDGSYIAQRIGNIVAYAGYMSHWWGPGWDTALTLSNDARPFPQIGYRRLSTTPLDWPVLRWFGPWNHETFLGVLNDPRRARNTLVFGTRFAFNPFNGFEMAVAGMKEFCGTGHPCKPIAELFNVQNNNQYTSKSKDEIDFDFRYTNTIGDWTYAIYNQEMNRDSGPFVHSDTSHLFGASLWVPYRSTAIRLTAEYADTISTRNFFSFGKDFYGITYNDYKYLDGWEYRGRTLGSSLDTDSRLASFHASWLGPHDWTYTLTYYRAMIESPNSQAGYINYLGYSPTPTPVNRVTSAPVTIDIGEARVRFPFAHWFVDLAVRVQDDQPRPQHGFAAAGEIRLSYRL